MSNKVLVADDDGNLRETLGEVLRSSGYEPVLVPSGDQALAKYDELAAAGDPPAAFVVDLLLPKVAGFDVLKQLTAKGNAAPVILMSGVFKGTGHQEEGQKLGAAGFLVKPFDNDALTTRLEKLIGPAGGSAGPPPGVEQRPMPPEGTLLENPVLHLLWRAEREIHSGVLEVFTPKGRGRVFVFRGQCTLAQHWSKTLNVGFQLVKSGHLTPEMFQEAIDEACTRGVGLHEVIKGRAWVRDAEMKEAYRAIVPRIVRKLVPAQGNFRWVPTEDFAKLIPAATSKLHDMLLAGVREASAAELAYHLDPRGPLRIAPGENWEQTVRHLEKACGSSSLERAINGRATITQLLAAARNDDDRVMRMRQIYLLMSTQSVQASLEVIKMANPPPDPEPGPVAPAPPNVAHGAVVSPTPSPRFDPASTSDDGDDALDAGIAFNLEEEDARERIRMKWSMVKGKDHWTVLGVERGADQGEIKKAYFGLAREYHADAFSGMRLGSAQPVLDQLFAVISEAYNTLSNPAKRAEYEASVNMQEAGVSTDLGALFAAERDFDKGRLLLERGELTSAARFFEKALAANPSNTQWEAHTVYAQWWLARDAGKAPAAIGRLEAIWKDNPQFLDALYFAGRLSIEAGQEDRGRKMLKKVLSDDPQHAMAQRDLRHLAKKGEDAAKERAAAGGLMGRFLKR